MEYIVSIADKKNTAGHTYPRAILEKAICAFYEQYDRNNPMLCYPNDDLRYDGEPIDTSRISHKVTQLYLANDKLMATIEPHGDSEWMFKDLTNSSHFVPQIWGVGEVSWSDDTTIVEYILKGITLVPKEEALFV